MALDTAVIVGSLSVQGNDYPIYGTFDRAREYFIPHVSGATYLNAAFADQQRGLVSARRLLDRQNYRGSKTVETQITAFPRDSETTVPLGVEAAQYEIALLLLEDAEFFNQNTTGSNERRLRAGPVEIEFFSQTLRSTTIGGTPTFPPQIQELLRPYLTSAVQISTPFAGGIRNPSNVISRQGNDISDGL